MPPSTAVQPSIMGPLACPMCKWVFRSLPRSINIALSAGKIKGYMRIGQDESRAGEREKTENQQKKKPRLCLWQGWWADFFLGAPSITAFPTHQATSGSCICMLSCLFSAVSAFARAGCNGRKRKKKRSQGKGPGTPAKPSCDRLRSWLEPIGSRADDE